MSFRSTLPFVLVAFLISTSAAAQDLDTARDRQQQQDQLQTYEADQLRERLRDRLHLSKAEADGLDEPLRRYLRLHGDPANMEDALRTGYEQGCSGTCLREMAMAMNRAMVQGIQDREARNMVCDALRDQVRERDRQHAGWTDQELGERVRDRVQLRLREWDREHQQLLEQEMKRDQEREMRRQTERDGQQGRQGKGRGTE